MKMKLGFICNDKNIDTNFGAMHRHINDDDNTKINVKKITQNFHTIPHILFAKTLDIIEQKYCVVHSPYWINLKKMIRQDESMNAVRLFISTCARYLIILIEKKPMRETYNINHAKTYDFLRRVIHTQSAQNVPAFYKKYSAYKYFLILHQNKNPIYQSIIEALNK